MNDVLHDLMTSSTADLVPSPGFVAGVVTQAHRRRRRTRQAVAAGAVVAVAGAASLSVLGSGDSGSTLYANGTPTPAPTRVPVSKQLQTICELSPGGRLAGPTDLVGPTGDPIDNCARFWKHIRGTDAPPLVAYQDKYGTVFVHAASEPLPEGAVLLPPGTMQDGEAVVIFEALSDAIALGPEKCRTKEDGLADATRIVRALHFANWPVHIDASYDDPQRRKCYGFAPDLRDHTVRVAATEAVPDLPAFVEQIVRPLRASLTECWSRATALSRVHAAVQNADVQQEYKDAVEIRIVDVPSQPCTTVRYGGGGGISFTLRGPA